MAARCPTCKHPTGDPTGCPACRSGGHTVLALDAPDLFPEGDSETPFTTIEFTARLIETGPSVDESDLIDTPLPGPTHAGRSRAGSIPGTGPAVAADRPPAVVPGYRVERVLGTGGMGTVYLARQLSLDRPVALKVMSRKWADDPVFVARFTREAFAAATLSHPNVVPIYDIGECDGYRYFSMEYVPGRSLADLIKAEGRIDPETAVGYVLQAGRGLKHAHDRGIIHRDVKPDNLLLDEHGVVKVADLGLVKTTATAFPPDPGPEVAGRKSDPAICTPPPGYSPTMTGVRIALGTPAFMAPEQCRDAATVDHRADVYSLGCTLYALVTGRQPFEGSTAVELMTQHAYASLTPPEQIAARVPKELSAVIQRMMAKRPDDRFQSMGEVIRTLGQWLGVQPTGTFAARDDQIAQLEQAVRRYNTAPAAVLRGRLVSGGVTACLVAAVLLAFADKLGWAFGLAGLVVQAAVAHFVLVGLGQGSYLFGRVRQLAAGSSVGDWLVVVAGTGLFAVLLWVLNLFWLWVGFGLIGAGLAIGVRFGLDAAAQAERAAPLAAAEGLLRRMRLSGVDEEELRQFVARFGGRDWEAFYEELFGFESKLAARSVLLRGGSAGVRNKHAAWREPAVGLIDRIEQGRREAREKRLLQSVEQARLRAVGLESGVARYGAAAAATAMLAQADAQRTADQRAGRAPVGGSAPVFGGATLGELIAQAEADPLAYVADLPPAPDPLTRVFGLLLGPAVRAVAAAGLLAVFVLWVIQTRGFADMGPLTLPAVPPAWTDWADSANPGWAAVLLLISLYYRGHRSAALALLGAAVTVIGHRFDVRTVEPIQAHHVTLLLGTVIALVGFRFGDRV
ncbi:MAG: protein kinase [Gemmataceae bacterium]